MTREALAAEMARPLPARRLLSVLARAPGTPGCACLLAADEDCRPGYVPVHDAPASAYVDPAPSPDCAFDDAPAVQME
jgi:hypothetical protein